jgi:hypothetical protein
MASNWWQYQMLSNLWQIGLTLDSPSALPGIMRPKDGTRLSSFAVFTTSMRSSASSTIRFCHRKQTKETRRKKHLWLETRAFSEAFGTDRSIRRGTPNRSGYDFWRRESTSRGVYRQRRWFRVWHFCVHPHFAGPKYILHYFSVTPPWPFYQQTWMVWNDWFVEMRKKETNDEKSHFFQIPNSFRCLSE